MSSRETVLGRIRSALAADTTPPPPIPRDYIRVGDHPPGSPPVLELMIDRLVDYKAHVREISPDQLADAIDTALADQRSVVLAPDLDPAIAAAAARSGRTLTTDGTPTVLTPERARPDRRRRHHRHRRHRVIRHHRPGRRPRARPPRHHPGPRLPPRRPARRADRAHRPRSHRPPRPRPPPDHDRRTLRHQRHRTRTRRRRARPPHPVRAHRALTRPSRGHLRAFPPPRNDRKWPLERHSHRRQ